MSLMALGRYHNINLTLILIVVLINHCVHIQVAADR